MNIGLDYDDTFTRDPEFWKNFCEMTRIAGHTIHIVTWRSRDFIGDMYDFLPEWIHIYFTACRAKRPYMEALGIHIDVWIDDNPEAVVRNYGEF
jgi:hypothetical protein